MACLRTFFRIINPFDFFLEPEATEFPFHYEGWLDTELLPYRQALPAGGASGALEEAISRFSSFHARKAVAHQGADHVTVDPKLALYYSNRLVGYGLEAEVSGAGVVR